MPILERKDSGAVELHLTGDEKLLKNTIAENRSLKEQISQINKMLKSMESKNGVSK